MYCTAIGLFGHFLFLSARPSLGGHDGGRRDLCPVHAAVVCNQAEKVKGDTWGLEAEGRKLSCRF
jgi:hypothetical protein